MTTGLHRVRASNAGPMTLSGTNSYLLTRGETVWVVDPGPADRDHLQELLDVVVATGAHEVGGIVLTHHHADHTDGVAALQRALSAASRRSGRREIPVWAADPHLVPRSTPIPDLIGPMDDPVAEVIRTPGHTGDSLCLLLPGGRLLTGDTVLGHGTSVIMADGSLRTYLDVLRFLRDMAADGTLVSIHPGHGDEIEGPQAIHEHLGALIEHREARIREVQAAMWADLTVDQTVEHLYGEQLSFVPEEHRAQLRSAAALNVEAAIEYLSGN
ncbi:MBL fold metallo-hydrolase [Helcobacillus massiliensis]|uniref:MBL fold metallo-hydrolase n=1 Tax=Helcobacillus massiliensis TaxID=521392 RepID=UPI0025574981|nr:MBL fold metallo-hydrolase [Helcobacillus massiliensis]WOO93064.1 MBL fold metallo-hydrolase [Helcobacillus massiliensis]